MLSAALEEAIPHQSTEQSGHSRGQSSTLAHTESARLRFWTCPPHVFVLERPKFQPFGGPWTTTAYTVTTFRVSICLFPVSREPLSCLPRCWYFEVTESHPSRPAPDCLGRRCPGTAKDRSLTVCAHRP